MITVSAPGKLMLLGEHAVVYGQPCLVTAVNERLHVSIEPAETVTFETPHTRDTRFLEAALAVSKKRLGLTDTAIKISTHNGFSAVKGFGSSSAVTVATIQAISQFAGFTLSNKKLFDLAYEAVLSVQGVGSGFDVAAATYGGTIQFSRGGEMLEPLAIPGTLPLVVGYTGIKADTAAIVKEVATKREQHTEPVDRIFAAIGELVLQAKVAMQSGDWQRVGKLMDFNQEYLRDLGVSSEKLETLISAAKTAEAYGAKLSGAGRGDCMIAVVSPDRKHAVESAIREAGGEVVSVGVHAPGVMIDTTDDQSELFVVVDAEDRVIGYRTRYECHHDKSLIHRTVGVILVNGKGDVLLQKRSLTKDTSPGCWGLSSAGHVNKGQSDDEAVQRELQEELGITVPVQFLKKFIVEDVNETERAAVYRGVYEGPFSPDSKEVEEVRFFSRQEIQQGIQTGTLHFSGGTEATLREIGYL